MAVETFVRDKRLPLKRSATPAASPVMTFEEFLNWDGENQHVEWVDGRVVEMSPITEGHQDLAGFLVGLLRAFVRKRKVGKILFDPYVMKTGPDLPGRAPDILFVSNQNTSRLKGNYLDGPADLVIEIISPGSRTVDNRDKYSEYEAGGVPEYWILDPVREQAQFYQLSPDGKYQAIAPDSEDVYHSRSLAGLDLPLKWLWQPEEWEEEASKKMWESPPNN